MTSFILYCFHIRCCFQLTIISGGCNRFYIARAVLSLSVVESLRLRLLRRQYSRRFRILPVTTPLTPLNVIKGHTMH